eukprot:524158-Rhodomonas_salina.1
MKAKFLPQEANISDKTGMYWHDLKYCGTRVLVYHTSAGSITYRSDLETCYTSPGTGYRSCAGPSLKRSGMFSRPFPLKLNLASHETPQEATATVGFYTVVLADLKQYQLETPMSVATHMNLDCVHYAPIERFVPGDRTTLTGYGICTV